MFGKLGRGEGYSGAPGNNMLVHLEGDMKEFDMKFEGWIKGRQKKAGRWFREVEEKAEAFMQNWHDTESCRAAARYAKAATVPPTVDTNTRR